MAHQRIAFVGGLRTGKDTAANFLVASFGFRRISISETVKATVNAAFQAAGFDTTNKGFMRAPLQDGGLAGRGVDPELWVGSVIRRYRLEDEHQGSGFACSDVRYRNEAELLRKCGFLIVRIAASRETQEARAQIDDGTFDPSVFEHPSETEMTQIVHDVLIENDTPEDRERMFATLTALVTDPSYADADD
jgi:dephospho-CoA kinase